MGLACRVTARARENSDALLSISQMSGKGVGRDYFMFFSIAEASATSAL